MPKQKFNNYDIRAEVACLRARLVGTWLTNVYDRDKTSFVFKFTRSGGATESGEGEKINVVIESGTRFHRTSHARASASGGGGGKASSTDQPSKFNAKLRMHLRGKRLNAIDQIGSDRAVDFTFSSGDTEHHLIVELYAQGNVLLLDKDDVVLTLLRTHRDDDKGVKILGNHRYPRERFRTHKRVTLHDLEGALVGRARGEDTLAGAAADSNSNSNSNSTATDAAAAAAPPRAPATLREALCKGLGQNPPLVDRAAKLAGLPMGGNTPLPLKEDSSSLNSNSNATAPVVERLLRQLSVLDDWFEGVGDGSAVPTGVVTRRRKPGATGDDDDAFVVDDFSPLPPIDAIDSNANSTATDDDDARVQAYESFDDALDAYFASFETQAATRQRERAEKAVVDRLEKVRSTHWSPYDRVRVVNADP
jgi:predicted ribosome quality control (RQC) complex YloA/Tae2 family protein